jgi:Family of unknown function (DUF695)
VFGRKSKRTEEDAWTVEETTHDGRRLIVRANEGARTLSGDPRLGIKVGLAVPFHDPDRSGMLSTQEAKQLNATEDQIVASLNGHAHLVLVLTTNGMREFVAYTGDGGWLPAFDRELQETITTHAVQIDARADPDWTAYRAFVS